MYIASMTIPVQVMGISRTNHNNNLMSGIWEDIIGITQIVSCLLRYLDEWEWLPYEKAEVKPCLSRVVIKNYTGELSVHKIVIYHAVYVLYT